MSELIVAVATAYGVVFLAELGDKTQLLALGFGAKYSLRTVAVGLAIGFGAAGAVAALVGGVLGATLPDRPIALAGGALFLLFAALTMFERDDDDGGDDADAADASNGKLLTRSVIVSIALSIAIGELGDKTQLATATLAAQNNPFATWVGATGGTVSAAMVGAFAGSKLGSRLNPDAIKYASAALFAIFGLLLLLSA